MPPIIARYTFTLQDYMAGGMYILRHRLSKKVIDVLIILMLANLLWSVRDDFNLRVFYFSILPFLLVATILKLLPWITLRCSYAKQADANMELICSFTADAIVVASTVSRA